MISWFKKHFIPHEGNEHRPHFLRKENTRNILILLVFIETFTFLIPTITRINNMGGMAAVLPAVLGDLTNEERQNQNLSVLSVNPVLNKAAEMKAEDMATKGYFAHTSPEGKNPWYWLEQAGYKYQYAGENLAINFTDSKDVTDAWMNSPTHRANIVKDKYTEVGTGVATGIYEGKETVFVAQVYANPAVKEVEPIVDNTKKDVVKTKTSSSLAKADNAIKVLGAETVNKTEDKNIVSPVKVKDSIVNNTPVNKIESSQKSTFVEKVVASPRNSSNTILYIISGIIILSLLLNIFIKIKHHHPDLITNGLITLVVIGMILVANYYITHKSMVVTQSIDYTNEVK